MDTKQAIVIRKNYTNSKGEQFKLRRGKEIAQASHAAMAFLTKPLANNESINVTDAVKHWMLHSFRKICLQVDTEEELLNVYKKALEQGLVVHLIQDAGCTEFNGEKTFTCLAIGPDWEENIDVVTKDLRLY